MLLPVTSPRLPFRFFALEANSLQPHDGAIENSFTLLCTRHTPTGSLLIAGLAQMGMQTVVARTPLDAIHHLHRTDIRFGAVFVSVQDHDFGHQEFLTFLEEEFPQMGRVVVAAHEIGDETIVWAQPDAGGSQDWRTEAGGVAERNWRLRFSGAARAIVGATLIH